MAEGARQGLQPAGGMTIYNAAEWKASLLQALEQGETLELDLSRVEELDSAGLQVLMLAKREAAQRGKQLTIVAHSAPVQEVFDLLDLAGWFGDPMLMPPSRDMAPVRKEA